MAHRSQSTRIPRLGPRGEGWVAVQVVLMFAIVVIAVRGDGAGTIALDPSLGTAAGVIGALAVLAGLVLIGWASSELRRGQALTATPRPRAAGSFVDSGPYRRVRHPIYSGLVLAAIGAAVFRLSIPGLLAAGLLLVVLDLKRRREEVWLAERYPEYAAYWARTDALVPFVY